jgi:hypothetical protein
VAATTLDWLRPFEPGGHICFLFGLQIENSSSQKYFYDNFYKILLSSFKEKVLSDPTEMYFFVFAIFQLAFSVTYGRSVGSMGTPVSSTNKTDCHDITEILLKVALNKPSSFSSTGLVFQYRSLT